MGEVEMWNNKFSYKDVHQMLKVNTDLNVQDKTIFGADNLNGS